jgi:hypothetical protein
MSHGTEQNVLQRRRGQANGFRFRERIGPTNERIEWNDFVRRIERFYNSSGNFLILPRGVSLSDINISMVELQEAIMNERNDRNNFYSELTQLRPVILERPAFLQMIETSDQDPESLREAIGYPTIKYVTMQQAVRFRRIYGQQIIVREPTPVQRLNQLQAVDAIHEDCSICMNTLESDCIQLPACSHHFHRRCLAPWFDSNNNCPLCRQTAF